MTLSKLAQLANVSVSVVSKAFSGREDVSESMREHVFAVAREHGCFQQFYHVPYDKPVVAVIIPELISQYYIHYMETLKKSLEESGYTMLLSISNFDNRMEEELIRYHIEHGKVDGLIVFGTCPILSNTSTAVIFWGHENLGFGCNVGLCLKDGMEQALLSLKAAGHRRIAYVGEPLTEKKALLFKELLKQHGFEVPKEFLISSRFRFAQAGADGVRHLWQREQKPTAIFGAYGYITQGILSELERMGVSVPEEVSVISMDSDPYPLHSTRAVACIPSEIEAVCAAMMRALSERIRSKHPNRPQIIEVSTRFVNGDTVGYAKN